MSILIKGMEIPRNCEDCMLRDELANGFGDIISEWCPLIGKDVEEYGWKGKQERHPDCSLVEVPTPHGRLIDGDDLITAFPANENGTDVKIASVRGTMLHAPTVIEAEEEE